MLIVCMKKEFDSRRESFNAKRARMSNKRRNHNYRVLFIISRYTMTAKCWYLIFMNRHQWTFAASINNEKKGLQHGNVYTYILFAYTSKRTLFLKACSRLIKYRLTMSRQLFLVITYHYFCLNEVDLSCIKSVTHNHFLEIKFTVASFRRQIPDFFFLKRIVSDLSFFINRRHLFMIISLLL